MKKILMLGSLLLLTVACGNNSWVTDVKLRTYQDSGDMFGEVITTLATGSTSLPSIEVPIYDPRNPSVNLGYFGLQPALSGSETELLIAVNMTKAAQLPQTSKPLLPNGKKLPISGYDENNMLMFTVSDYKARIYFDLNTASNYAIVGAAVPIKQFDNIGSTIGSMNVFPTFTLDSVRGAFGFFTGKEAGQSGFAVFIDASSLLAELQAGKMTVMSSNATKIPAIGTGDTGDNSKLNKLKRSLYFMNATKARLQLH